MSGELQTDSGARGTGMTGERLWDRREFIGTVGATAAGALAPTVATAFTSAVTSADSGPAALVDWTIDDMFGVWPRYADPIPHGHPPADLTAPDEPLDAL